MTVFRITQRSLSSGVLANLQNNLDKMQQLQDHLSSGKQVNKPSDAPANSGMALQYRAQIRRTDQYSRNAQDGLGWLGTADNTLTSALDSVRRARELVLSGSNATAGPSEREAMAAEVDSLRDGLINLGNAAYAGKPIFAGTAQVQNAFDASGNYLGDSGTTSRTVAQGVSVPVNLTGTEVFGSGSTSLFNILTQISTDLRSGTAADINNLNTNDLNALDAATTVVQNKLSDIGARYNRVQTMQSRADNAKVTLTQGLSDVEDVDLAKTITDLQLQQVSYQAALSATAKVIQPSLLDFLK